MLPVLQDLRAISPRFCNAIANGRLKSLRAVPEADGGGIALTYFQSAGGSTVHIESLHNLNLDRPCRELQRARMSRDHHPDIRLTGRACEEFSGHVYRVALSGAARNCLFPRANSEWHAEGARRIARQRGGRHVEGTLRSRRGVLSLGATVIVTMQNDLASPGAGVPIIEGAVFVLCVMSLCERILGGLARRLHRPL